MAGRGRYIGGFTPECPRINTPEEAARATPEERIESIWPYVCYRVHGFVAKLKPRELANYDQDDIAQDLWVMLREKDEFYRPDRGDYISFASSLISRHLCTVREASHTVRSPRNSDGRIRQFEAEAEANGGELSPIKEATYRATVRADGGVTEIDEDGGAARPSPTPLDVVEEKDRLSVVMDAIEEGVEALSLQEALVLGRTFGLWGRLPDTAAEVAADLGCETERVKRLKSQAISKVRDRLLAMGHPAVASDN